MISLTDSMQDLYNELMNIPNVKAEENIEKINDQLDILDAKYQNLISANNKNKNIDQQSSAAKNIRDQYASAYSQAQKNLSSAKSAINQVNDAALKGLKKDAQAIVNGVRSGQKIEIKDEWTTKAKKAVAAYNAALDASYTATINNQKATEEYTTTLRENQKAKFDNIQTEYANRVQMLDYGTRHLDNKIAETEASGANVDIAYYNEQKKINAQKMDQYKAEKSALEESIKNIQYGTEEWYDAYDALRSVSDEISECTQNTYELNAAINQAHYDLFNSIHDEVERLMDEQDFLSGLFSHEKMVDADTAKFTDAGRANIGSIMNKYYSSLANVENDRIEVERLQEMLNSGNLGNFNSENELREKLSEMYDQWRDDIKTTYDLESDAVDAMSEKYQAQLDLMQDLIDARKDALKAEKDLHDYQRTVDEKVQDISVLQKQIAAYSGDSSSEAIANLQRMQKELSEKQDDLRETEYDKYISDQEDILDKLYGEYEELITKKMDDFYSLFEEAKIFAENNIDGTNDYLSSIAKQWGYEQENPIVNSTNTISGNIDKIVSILSEIQNRLYPNGEVDTNTGSIINPTSSTDQGSSAGKGSSGSQGIPSLDGLNSKDLTQSVSDYTKNLLSSLPMEERTIAGMLASAKSYVKEHASKTSKGKSSLSDINKKIYSWSNTKGKILSTKELKELASILDVKYDNAKSSGNLYKKLKKIKFPGFKQGGKVVAIDDIDRAIKENGDDAIASVKVGETILNKVDTKRFEQIMSKIESIPAVPKNLVKASTILPENATRNIPSVQYGDVLFKFNLPNVKDSNDLLHTIQNDRKIQKALQSVTVDLIAGKGKLPVRNIK